MNISGIRPLIGHYDYNSIRSYEVSDHDATDKNIQKTEELANRNEQDHALRQNQDFDSLDYADLYQPKEEFNMKGQDSDLFSLDMEKAISDMKKDQVLQQYQFFVGESSGQDKVIMNQEKSRNVFRKDQNFTIL